jgi:hypothetical protein
MVTYRAMDLAILPPSFMHLQSFFPTQHRSVDSASELYFMELQRHYNTQLAQQFAR